MENKIEVITEILSEVIRGMHDGGIFGRPTAEDLLKKLYNLPSDEKS